MNETKRMFGLFGGVILFIGLICLIAFWPEKDRNFTCKIKADKGYTKVAELDYEGFECLKKEGNYTVAIADKITEKQKKELNTSFDKADNGVYLISLKNFSKTEIKDIKKTLDNSFENEALIYVEDKKVKASKENILNSKKEIKTFGEENHLISKILCGAKDLEDYKNIKEVDYKGFKCLYEQNEPYVIVLAQTTCGYCEKYKPVLEDVLIQNNINAYLINIDKISQEESTKLTSSLDYFSSNQQWGTPLTLAIQNKKIIDDIGGYNEDKTAIKKLFAQAGIIK